MINYSGSLKFYFTTVILTQSDCFPEIVKESKYMPDFNSDVDHTN